MKPLRQLSLSNNTLQGQLPSEWSSWSSIQQIMLTDNDLSGIIPTQLSSLADTLFQVLHRLPSRMHNCHESQAVEIFTLSEHCVKHAVSAWMSICRKPIELQELVLGLRVSMIGRRETGKQMCTGLDDPINWYLVLHIHPSFSFLLCLDAVWCLRKCWNVRWNPTPPNWSSLEHVRDQSRPGLWMDAWCCCTDSSASKHQNDRAGKILIIDAKKSHLLVWHARYDDLHYKPNSDNPFLHLYDH